MKKEYMINKYLNWCEGFNLMRKTCPSQFWSMVSALLVVSVCWFLIFRKL